MKSHDLITELCRTHTNLEEEDIRLLIKVASKLQDISEKGQVDAFIDCPCKDPTEAIVVEQAIKDSSLYEFSTVGYIIREDDEPAVFRSFRLGVETEGVKAVTYASTAQNLVVQDVTPIKKGNRTIGALIFERELPKNQNKSTYSNKAAIPQQEYKQRYMRNVNWLSECILDAVIIVDEFGRVQFRNSAAKKMYENYGYVHDIEGLEYWKVSLHGDLRVDLSGKQDFFEQELYIHGRYYVFKQYRFTMEETFYVVVIQDITAIRHNERMLQLKTVAMREMHHRIKNSLYTVHSLLEMQKRRVASEKTKSIFQNAMNRIFSIAATYEILQIDGLDSVSLIKVINSIVQNFLSLIEIDDKLMIDVTVDGDDILLNTDLSASVALVVNELLQNCHKHAFNGKNKGNISIIIKKTPIYSSIEVADDGVGISLKENIASTNSHLGLNIIEMVVKDKLKGRLDICSNKNGTKVTFDFKTPKH